MYIQYKNKKYDESWNNFGGRINPGRNYDMFGILASGVRTDWNKSFNPRGLPNKISLTIEEDLHNPIYNDKHNICNRDDVINPDSHSHNYLSVDEYNQALKWYREQTKSKPPLEYKVLLKLMRELENKKQNEVMIVFWFDN